MTEKIEEQTAQRPGEGLPTQRLVKELRGLAGALGERALASMTDRATALTARLTEYAEGGGKAGSRAGQAAEETSSKAGRGLGVLHGVGRAVKGVGQAAKGVGQVAQAVSGSRKGKAEGDKTRVTNIIESIDIGAPRSVVYDQWTRFEDFPSFMKKVENVKQESDEELTWKAQIFWSHRSWKAEIIDQVPDERILWRSSGEKGYVDGAVTFHELEPRLTRVMLVLEYHPKGFFEHVGNLWRAQGRRVRLELKHFRRHVMTQTLLHPEEVEGWRKEIHEGSVVSEDESAEGAENESAAEEEQRPADEKAAESKSETEPEKRKRKPAAAGAEEKDTEGADKADKEADEEGAAEESSAPAR